ncbi:MAG: phage portal protein, partial [Desulfobacteraceae bacterium]
MRLGVISRISNLIRRKEAPVYFPETTRQFFWSPHNIPQNALKTPYSQHAWVYSCISAIATNISSVPLQFLTGDRKNSKPVEQHALVELFDSPNPYMSGGQLIEAAFVFLGLFGECFFILDR